MRALSESTLRLAGSRVWCALSVMQQLVLDVTKEAFPKFLHDTFLLPIGMNHSTCEQPRCSAFGPAAATPYAGDGTSGRLSLPRR
jgi:hypothetical protein